MKTRDVIADCLGGVLFIDEAYALGNREKRDSFAKEYCLNQEKLIEAILCEDDCKTEKHGQFVFCWEVWGKGSKKKHCLILLDQQAGFIYCNAALFT